MKQCIKCGENRELSFYSEGRNVCRICRNKQKIVKVKHEPTNQDKVCGCCGELKSADNFSPDRQKKDGRHSYCNECRSKKQLKRYYNNHEEHLQKASTRYYTKTKFDRDAKDKTNARVRKRTQQDPVFRMTRRIRARTRIALRERNFNNPGFIKYIGCDLETLVKHIESRFTEGMSWENIELWHLDHIVPLVSASTEEELIKLAHYTNLQPLWAVDNIKKGAKI